MKKIIFSAAVAAMLASCAGGKGYTVTGHVEGVEGYVYLENSETHAIIDSAKVVDGRFVFEGKVETPMLVVVHDAPSDDADPAIYANLFLEPGDAVIETDGDDVAVSGTPANEAFAAFRAARRELLERYYADGTTVEERRTIEVQHDSMVRKAMEDNRTNLFGAIVLAQNLAYELSGSEMIAEIEKFPAELQATALLTKARETAEAKARTEVGQPYIDVEQNDADGNALALSAVVADPANKYVLVDFWASWCGPCMGEVPYLVETYAKYHDKGFEIYGISFDKNRDAWLAAVADKQMTWLHVSDLTGFDNQAARDYAVQGIPSNFLVETASGTIVATNLRGEALGEKIAELLD
ncbi:MAG: AhpC/TSA family protein [Alistipes sp.]|nr:AhpC/TSA family protein [Alistipes sp.]